MKQIRLILVGGFLGAGKTTLLGQAARILVQQGKRVGLVTNDQAQNLVDTSILRNSGMQVEEIAGGCFCCRFDSMTEAFGRLTESDEVDILIAEPVGSCTDISATVLQPLKRMFLDRYRLSPFSVLVDPLRLQEVLDPRMRSTLHPSARYILKKQLEEADIVVINKIDLVPAPELAELQAKVKEVFPHTSQLCLSALNGYGVQEWLDMLLEDDLSGQHIIDVDYDIYAEGEAVLGWLNAAVSLSCAGNVNWDDFATGLLERLRSEFMAQFAEIAHVKLVLHGLDTSIIANLTGNASEMVKQGSIAGSQHDVKLILNARVEIAPEKLQTVVENALKAQATKVVSFCIDEIMSLSPGRPAPTHRYSEVISEITTDHGAKQ